MFHTHAAAIWNFSEDLETYQELIKGDCSRSA